MTAEPIQLTQALYQYLQKMSMREPKILQALRIKTQQMVGANMQIAPEQGQFMALLIELMQAQKTLDIGTFTGYSALVVALALPQNGKVISCDINQEATEVAKEFWQKAGVAHQIDLKIAPALTTLEELLSAGEANTFDFVFIDADKKNYLNYYEYALKLLRVGGLIVVDNVLWNGKVIDLNHHDATTKTIRHFNEKLHQDERVTLSIIPIGDGLTLARKR